MVIDFAPVAVRRRIVLVAHDRQVPHYREYANRVLLDNSPVTPCRLATRALHGLRAMEPVPPPALVRDVPFAR